MILLLSSRRPFVCSPKVPCYLPNLFEILLLGVFRFAIFPLPVVFAWDESRMPTVTFYISIKDLMMQHFRSNMLFEYFINHSLFSVFPIVAFSSPLLAFLTGELRNGNSMSFIWKGRIKLLISKAFFRSFLWAEKKAICSFSKGFRPFPGLLMKFFSSRLYRTIIKMGLH